MRRNGCVCFGLNKKFLDENGEIKPRLVSRKTEMKTIVLAALLALRGGAGENAVVLPEKHARNPDGATGAPAWEDHTRLSEGAERTVIFPLVRPLAGKSIGSLVILLRS